jgi:hypothetical protein
MLKPTHKHLSRGIKSPAHNPKKKSPTHSGNPRNFIFAPPLLPGGGGTSIQLNLSLFFLNPGAENRVL